MINSDETVHLNLELNCLPHRDTSDTQNTVIPTDMLRTLQRQYSTFPKSTVATFTKGLFNCFLWITIILYQSQKCTGESSLLQTLPSTLRSPQAMMIIIISLSVCSCLSLRWRAGDGWIRLHLFQGSQWRHVSLARGERFHHRGGGSPQRPAGTHRCSCLWSVCTR